MAGFSVLSGPHKGLGNKKPSSVVTNSEELGLPFQDLRCTDRRQHLTMKGNPKHFKEAEVWTWDEAS